MTGQIVIRRAGLGLCVQDSGRPGFLAQGLPRGGAADRTALAEGAALLSQPARCGALEMLATTACELEFTVATRIALTGAVMRARADGVALAWNASHHIAAGTVVKIDPSQSGNYGYLLVAGGVQTPTMLGSRAIDFTAGLGQALETGDRIDISETKGDFASKRLAVADRCTGGTVHVVASLQTHLFSDAVLKRFQQSVFHRDLRGNRMGARLTFDGPPFSADGQLDILSEVIVPGDIQMTGDGIPFVLMAESQTTGGYPRIATVLPSDLPRVAQARPDVALRFVFVDLKTARQRERAHRAHLAGLARSLAPLVRDPHDIADLLSYQLIDGVVSARKEDLQ